MERILPPRKDQPEHSDAVHKLDPKCNPVYLLSVVNLVNVKVHHGQLAVKTVILIHRDHGADQAV